VYLAEAQSSSPPACLGELGTNNVCVLYSADGEFLFAGASGGEVQVWSLAQRKLQHRLRSSETRVQRLEQDAGGSMLAALQWGDPAPIPLTAEAQAAVAEMAEGHKQWFLGFQTEPPARVTIWRVGNWRELKSWAIPGGVSACKLSPHGRLLATSHGQGSVYVWDLSDRCRSNLVACPAGVSGLSFSPDGHWLAAAISLAGSVRVWEMPGLKWHADLSLPDMASDLSFSLDSRRLATVNAGANAVSLWDVATWQPLITLERPQEWRRNPTFTSDGNQFNSINDKGEVLSWSASSFGEIEAKEKKARP
jgi:WD40 repeat protein